MSTAYLRRPTAHDEELRSTFRPVFDKIAAASLEREQSRVFPHEQVRWLNDAGFGTVRIPEEQGGFGPWLEQTFLLLSELGGPDATVSHLWRNHLPFVGDRR